MTIEFIVVPLWSYRAPARSAEPLTRGIVTFVMAAIKLHADPIDTAREEGRELVHLLHRLVDHTPALETTGETLATSLHRQLDAAAHPAEMERILESFSRELRALWLRSVAAETSRVLRSPLEKEVARLSARHDAFGYERDLQPEELEGRCDQFFDPVPAPWQSEHVLFSSGQAALMSILLAFQSPHPLRVQHLGGYFETRQLIQSCPSLCIPVERDADIVIAEPIASDGGFDYHSNAEIAASARGAKALALDTTLLGRADKVDQFLAGLDRDMLVLRCMSGLKLLQAGLELANVGIVGLHARSSDQLRTYTSTLLEMRTLCGTGLRFADVLALEAPFVFDPDYADRYAGAVFAHNAALAEAVAERNQLFIPPFAAHPSPYCVFSLRGSADGGYERLEDLIAARSTERGIVFDKGGSFGFRGHRYEVVRPEGRTPFLRVAMGRRDGWSCRGAIEILAQIAAQPSV